MKIEHIKIWEYGLSSTQRKIYSTKMHKFEKEKSQINFLSYHLKKLESKISPRQAEGNNKHKKSIKLKTNKQKINEIELVL